MNHTRSSLTLSVVSMSVRERLKNCRNDFTCGGFYVGVGNKPISKKKKNKRLCRISHKDARKVQLFGFIF